MERGVDNKLIAAWRWVAGYVIVPVTIIPGFRAVTLVVSSLCVPLDSWSQEGALANLSLGIPAAAGIAALWITTLFPLASIARTQTGFVLATTGLLMGLLLECLMLRAGLGLLASVDVFEVGLLGWLLVMGIVNLFLLIRARELLTRPRLIPVVEQANPRRRGRGVPRHHLRPGTVLQPVILQPYQPPVSSRPPFGESDFDWDDAD